MPADENAPLKGKVILVSGASKRLGRCYALALARAGAQVIALARTLGDETAPMGTLREVERSAQAAGIAVSARCCDITDEEALKRTVLEVADQFGGIDGIVNNAVAYSTAMQCRGITHDVWNEAFNVNVRAPYVLIDTAAPIMEARGGGSVINITSLAAGPTGKGGGAHKGLLLYGLTKAALNRMTSWYAAELEDRNIAVNAISPGDVSVYMRMANGLDPEDRQLEVVEGAQLDEDFWGGPVVWLAAARPAEMTGQTLHTYTFGEEWGPPIDVRDRSPLIQKILGRDNLAPR